MTTFLLTSIFSFLSVLRELCQYNARIPSQLYLNHIFQKMSSETKCRHTKTSTATKTREVEERHQRLSDLGRCSDAESMEAL